MSTIISTNLRYVTLGLSRAFGGFYYWLTRSWRPPLFWLILTGVAIWATDNYDIIFHHKAGTWFQWWNVLAVYTLLWLLWWAWQARKRVVIEDFMDYTVSPPKSDSRGLATLLVVRLAQLQELYHVVDEQRSISTEAKSDQTIDATIKVEDVSQFLTGAISAQSKFSLGPLEIPVGTLLALIGRLVQGPRIIGSLHKDKDILTLTAQRVGGEATYSWRVDSTLPTQSVDDITSTHDAMVNELACRMFTDLALSGSVRWRATSTFSEGLRAYRDCLRTPKNKKINLKMAEKKFLETRGCQASTCTIHSRRSKMDICTSFS
ncbi:MAG TPA: hypothetical protein VK140_10720 [Ktedonobacteraceae bacterium]|nr:hypothetical protein [Ktedonobacteraceae bacterium]